MKTKIIGIGLVAVIGFTALIFVLQGNIKKNNEIEAIEIALKIAEISKTIKAEQDQIIELKVQKLNPKYVFNFNEFQMKRMGDTHLTLTLYLTEEDFQTYQQNAGGNIRNSKEVLSLYKNIYDRVKQMYEDAPEQYEAKLKIMSSDFDYEKKMEGVDAQIEAMKVRLATLQK